jgi:CRP-like cAMP-binding protein
MGSVATDPRIAKALQRSPMFARLGEGDLAVLSGLGQLRHIVGGRVVFEKGSEPTEFFALLEGAARIVSPVRGAKELFVRELRPGDVFGELGVLDLEPRSAAVKTTAVSTLAAFDARDFRDFLVKSPLAALEMLRVLSSRVRDTTQRLEDQTFLKIEQRLAKALLELGQHDGVSTDEGIRIQREVTQVELAQRVGTAREGINRQLNTWEREGLIRRSESGMILCDPERLEAIAPAFAL